MIMVLCVQWYCLLIVDCPDDSNVYLDCPSNSFVCVMNQEHGPHLHVLKCRNNLLQAFEHIMNLLSNLMNVAGIHLMYIKTRYQ